MIIKFQQPNGQPGLAALADKVVKDPSLIAKTGGEFVSRYVQKSSLSPAPRNFHFSSLLEFSRTATDAWCIRNVTSRGNFRYCEVAVAGKTVATFVPWMWRSTLGKPWRL